MVKKQRVPWSSLAGKFVLGISLTVLLSFPVSQSVFARENSTLTVEVKGLKNQQGQVCMALFNSSRGFPQDRENAYYTKCTSISDRPLQVEIPDLPWGNYALGLFHDENADSEIDRNSIGAPKEGFGFSNNPKMRTRPANFGEAMFVVGGDNTTIGIEMQYPYGDSNS
jgi:uncharacterized protein (DUF2141 family)